MKLELHLKVMIKYNSSEYYALTSGGVSLTDLLHPTKTDRQAVNMQFQFGSTLIKSGAMVRPVCKINLNLDKGNCKTYMRIN
jgi:hypothetical protein